MRAILARCCLWLLERSRGQGCRGGGERGHCSQTPPTLAPYLANQGFSTAPNHFPAQSGAKTPQNTSRRCPDTPCMHRIKSRVLNAPETPLHRPRGTQRPSPSWGARLWPSLCSRNPEFLPIRTYSPSPLIPSRRSAAAQIPLMGRGN